ncbi:hypothetical protein GCM10007938_04350 [Vibrio zhanjiangensis]|uniref:Uncharacterized protein n=1 Tax=Vibrio zhanjiangensis TaxID=1046128 RepID=A0ABQ6EUK2_9VIBR|nr:hypothetical protein GCM10007938_04350 [Vibrio zhanjiangensis]
MWYIAQEEIGSYFISERGYYHCIDFLAIKKQHNMDEIIALMIAAKGSKSVCYLVIIFTC